MLKNLWSLFIIWKGLLQGNKQQKYSEESLSVEKLIDFKDTFYYF